MNNKSVAVLLDQAQTPAASCPLCHTVDAGTSDAALAGGASWKCLRCGQRWDARRLEAAADYERSRA